MNKAFSEHSRASEICTKAKGVCPRAYVSWTIQMGGLHIQDASRALEISWKPEEEQ